MFIKKEPKPTFFLKIASHLSKDGILYYRDRSLILYVNDEVEVMRGKYKGVIGKVIEINPKTGRVNISKTLSFLDRLRNKYEIIDNIHHSNLRIIKVYRHNDRRKYIRGVIDGW